MTNYEKIVTKLHKMIEQSHNLDYGQGLVDALEVVEKVFKPTKDSGVTRNLDTMLPTQPRNEVIDLLPPVPIEPVAEFDCPEDYWENKGMHKYKKMVIEALKTNESLSSEQEKGEN